MGDLKRPIMYVCQNPAGELKIGYQGPRSNRIADHALAGFDLRLAWPTDRDTEEIFHNDADEEWRKRGKEWYRPVAPLADWIEALVERGYAAAEEEDAYKLPELPYRVWSMEALRAHLVDENGQLGLLQALAEPAKRIEYASQWAQKQSRSDEWFTPRMLITPYHAMLEEVGERIDCDPASCFEANETIDAATYYTKPLDGLRRDRPWFGNLWLNPPYGRGERRAARWIERLLDELAEGTVAQTVTCLNADSMSTEWFRPIWARAALQVLLHGRPNFQRPGVDGGSPTKGTVMSYFGPHRERFLDHYGPLGHVLLPPLEVRQVALSA